MHILKWTLIDVYSLMPPKVLGLDNNLKNNAKTSDHSLIHKKQSSSLSLMYMNVHATLLLDKRHPTMVKHRRYT